jgi:hypothetical protein
LWNAEINYPFTSSFEQIMGLHEYDSDCKNEDIGEYCDQQITQLYLPHFYDSDPKN